MLQRARSKPTVLLRFVSRNLITDRWLRQNPGAMVECWGCSKPIQIHDPRQKYCSTICRKRYWRALRKEVFYTDCLWCGDEFEQARRDKVYCSKKCINSDRRERLGIPVTGRTKIKCPVCSIRFIKTARSQKYCSFHCFMPHRMNNKRLYSRIKAGKVIKEKFIEISKEDISESIANIKKSGVRTSPVFDPKSWAERARESQAMILKKYTNAP